MDNDEEIVVTKAEALGHELIKDSYGNIATFEDEYSEHPAVMCRKCNWSDCIYCITIYGHEIPKCND